MAAKLADMQEGVETAFSNVQLDEKTQHEDCPDNVKDALLFKVKSGVSSVSSNANRVFRREGAYDRYDLKDGEAGIDKTVASRPAHHCGCGPGRFSTTCCCGGHIARSWLPRWPASLP